MVNINKIKATIKERWKFYLVGYALGYFIPLIIDGAPNWKYFIPFKLVGVACALGIGTPLYYGTKKMLIFEGAYRSIKYIIFIILLMLLAYGIQQLLMSLFGIDITPFMGTPRPTS